MILKYIIESREIQKCYYSSMGAVLAMSRDSSPNISLCSALTTLNLSSLALCTRTSCRSRSLAWNTGSKAADKRPDSSLLLEGDETLTSGSEDALGRTSG